MRAVIETEIVKDLKQALPPEAVVVERRVMVTPEKRMRGLSLNRIFCFDRQLL